MVDIYLKDTSIATFTQDKYSYLIDYQNFISSVDFERRLDKDNNTLIDLLVGEEEAVSAKHNISKQKTKRLKKKILR